MLESAKSIFVTGHKGLVGSALCRTLQSEGFRNIITASRQELDLTNQAAVNEFMATHQPSVVIVSAGHVGGIMANNTEPAQFIFENTQIACNLIHASHTHRVSKLLYLGSSCIYPKRADQPISEDSLLAGPLEPTNQWYAVAKIAGIKLCQAYRRQYGCDFVAAMPTNLYGPGDHYDPERSHVLPALLHKFSEAKRLNLPQVECWGTGRPRREFLYVDDLASACIEVLNRYSDDDIINIGYGSDISILELTSMVQEIVGYQGEIVWDSSKPDGTYRKLLNSTKIQSLGWSPKTELREGMRHAYADYLDRFRRSTDNAKLSTDSALAANDRQGIIA